MRFAHPVMFHWLWAVVILAVFLYSSRRHHKVMMQRFSQEHLIKEIAPDFDCRRSLHRNILMIMVFVLAIAALARPQWGFQWQDIKRQGLDILVVVDTSKSMLTQDVKPNRLGRTKLAVQDLVKKLKGDRIGLMAFAGDAFLVCPLTVDYGGFLLSLNDLTVQTVPRPGTNLSTAIAEAIKSYDPTPDKYKAIVIITDGDNLEGDPLAAAKKAKEKGIKIYCVGIGTPEGELIQIVQETGETGFLKDSDGNFVKSRLNEELLQEISLTTDAAYVRSSATEFGLDLIYEQELTKLERRDIEGQMEKRYHERFQVPLGLAFLLLLVETCLPARKRK